MRISIITIGAPKLPFVVTGFNEYTKRIATYNKLSILHIPDKKNAEKKVSHFVEKNKNAHCVLLDEKGKTYTSIEYAQKIEDAINRDGIQHIAFIIGGPNGHSEELKQKISDHMSLSALTLPHDLAMLFLAEALYRSITINHQHPYHRS